MEAHSERKAKHFLRIPFPLLHKICLKKIAQSLVPRAACRNCFQNDSLIFKLSGLNAWYHVWERWTNHRVCMRSVLKEPIFLRKVDSIDVANIKTNGNETVSVFMVCCLSTVFVVFWVKNRYIFPPRWTSEEIFGTEAFGVCWPCWNVSMTS